MSNRARLINPARLPAETAVRRQADAGDLGEQRGVLVAELWSALAGPFVLNEARARADLAKIDAKLTKLEAVTATGGAL